MAAVTPIKWIEPKPLPALEAMSPTKADTPVLKWIEPKILSAGPSSPAASSAAHTLAEPSDAEVVATRGSESQAKHLRTLAAAMHAADGVAAIQVDADIPFMRIAPAFPKPAVAGPTPLPIARPSDAQPQLALAENGLDTQQAEPEAGTREPAPLRADAAQTLAALNPAAGPAHTTGGSDDSPQEVWLAVHINGEEQTETALLLRQPNGRLLVRRADLQRWRMQIPDAAPFVHNAETYFPLDRLSGVRYEIDESKQVLAITAEPTVFSGTRLKPSVALTFPSLPPIGGFLNYDLFASHALGQTRGSGLLELGAFGRWGTGVSSFLASDIGERAHYVRLDTTLTHDMPSELSSVRVGDAISRAGAWGRPVRFGGAQWATNFATQPGFVTFPLPGLTGEAVLPSTVDLYVNDALRMRREVPSGPFSITDLPIVTGQGEARVVVRDLLGRERVITQPYYATPRLLQPRLHDYSYEIGFARRNFGLESDDYGRFLAAGTHRFGFTDRFTGEAHGELLADQQTIGLGGAYLWSSAGVLSASAAASRSTRGVGALVGVGFERQTRTFSFGGSTQFATDRFVQLGLQPDELAPSQITQAFASLATGRGGSVGVNYVHQNYRDREDVRFAGASYSVSVGRVALAFSALRFLGNDAKTVVGFTMTLPLDARTSASVNATAQRGSDQALLQVQRSLPAGTGVGYRLLAAAGASNREEVGLSAQNDVGTYVVEAAHVGSETAYRASVSGGVAVIGNHAFLSRRISDSFAVVEVPDYPNVRVYADNQLVGRTRADGTALVPRLRPYENNTIRVEQSDLPLDAQVEGVQVEAVPYYRSGMLVRIPVKRSSGGLLNVVLENGDPLPTGAIARIVGRADEFPIGMKGEIYLTGLVSTNQVRIEWRGQSCELTVTYAHGAEPLPDLGTYTCKGVRP